MKLVRYLGLGGLLVFSIGPSLDGLAPIARAATSTTLDILPDSVMGSPDGSVVVTRPKAIVRENPSEGRPGPIGNPLWAVPLSMLTATQERPIFSALRRPPVRAVASSPVVALPAVTPPQPAAPPERPPLELIGAVVGENDAIAVFLDRTSQGIVRLRLGEARAGWTLSSIQPREVILKQGDQTESLVLQRTGLTASPDSVGAPPPVSGGTGTAYAPFVPRSTPKNGESDGL